MRTVLRGLLGDYRSDNAPPPTDHIGLSYGAWAPTGGDGTIPDKVDGRDYKANWLAAVASTPICADYRQAYNHWLDGLRAPGHALAVIETTARLLVGHGNPSATEVGLTVHHTWGVPMIPGSALKGITAAYLSRQVGGTEPERQWFRGVRWDEGRIAGGPGEVYRALFGAPDSDDGSRAETGAVVFHDALYMPGSLPHDRPYAVDVLTVHQRTYYGQQPRGPAAGERWPNDYDSPNPVGFITVRPGARFLLALEGDLDWTGFAQSLLAQALPYGIGAKTAAGYGAARIIALA